MKLVSSVVSRKQAEMCGGNGGQSAKQQMPWVGRVLLQSMEVGGGEHHEPKRPGLEGGNLKLLTDSEENFFLKQTTFSF